jgi:hypothetical protein
MLEWLREIPGLDLSEEITTASVQTLVTAIRKQNPGITLTSRISSKRTMTSKLTAKFTSKATLISNFSQDNAPVSKQGGKVFVVCDTCLESQATALVLCKIVTQHTMHESTMIPQLLPADGELPSTATICIFILKNGVFSCRSFMQYLISAGMQEIKHIPIIAEDSFRFPSKSLEQELQVTLPGLLSTFGRKDEIDSDVVFRLVQDIFKEIAVVFAPQDYSSTDTLLKLKASQVAQRLLGSRLGNLAIRKGNNDQSNSKVSVKDAPDNQDLVLEVSKSLSVGKKSGSSDDDIAKEAAIIKDNGREYQEAFV